MQHFDQIYDGKRFSEALVFNRPKLREMLTNRADFFSRWAITPASHPLQVLYAVETDDSGARFGGYGYLFGYPEYAVNFFVQAAAEEDFTGKLVERDRRGNSSRISGKVCSTRRIFSSCSSVELTDISGTV